MKKLYLSGWITKDSDGIIALKETDPKKEKYEWDKYGHSIITSIEDFAEEFGECREYEEGLGGRVSSINDCNLRIYFTNKECTLDDAMKAFDTLLYGGDLETEVAWSGYSEYTIMGLDLEKFTIGGHDLEEEILSHNGEYMHLILEC